MKWTQGIRSGVIAVLGSILGQAMVTLLESPRGRDLIQTLVTNAIAGGMKEKDVTTVGLSMIRQIMDPAINVEDLNEIRMETE